MILDGDRAGSSASTTGVRLCHIAAPAGFGVGLCNEPYLHWLCPTGDLERERSAASA